MVGAIVYVVIQNCTALVGILQKLQSLWSEHRIYNEIRAKHHNVVAVYLRQYKFEIILVVILVKRIVGIVIFIEESQRNGRFSFGIHTNVFRSDAVLFHEVDDIVANVVVADFRNHRYGHTASAKRNHPVESRTARNRCHRLFVPENNVENSLSYSYYLSHLIVIFNNLQIFTFLYPKIVRRIARHTPITSRTERYATNLRSIRQARTLELLSEEAAAECL